MAKQKEEISALKVEAEEMRDRIKKLAKFEKQEKAQSAMNEELKKMEQETGLSVSGVFFSCDGGRHFSKTMSLVDPCYSR